MTAEEAVALARVHGAVVSPPPYDGVAFSHAQLVRFARAAAPGHHRNVAEITPSQAPAMWPAVFVLTRSQLVRLVAELRKPA